MSDLDRFELFLSVAQEGSITQAAKKLGLTKASLSKQIKRLETDFKIDLFSRYGQRLHLTEQGKALLDQCLRLKKELDDARDLCQQFHQEPEGMLRIFAFKYFAKKIIFPKLKVFLRRYPKIELFIDTNERIPNFELEQVDLALGYSLPAPANIIQRKITTTRYVLCASPAYFAEHGKPKNLNELEGHLYIGHSSREDQIIKLKPNYHVTIKPYLFLNSVTAMIECAKEGLGLIQLPLYLLDELLQKQELIEILKDYQATNTNVYYYYPKFRYIQPKVRKFIDFFISENSL